MALKAVVDSLDDVDEGLHSHYEPEADGDRFRLKVDGYNDDEGLKQTLKDTKAKYRKLRAKMDAVPDDFDAAELAELRALKQQVADDSAKASGDWDSLRESMESRHKKEMEGLRTELGGMSTDLEKALKHDAASTLAADSGMRVSAVLPHILKRADLVTEDGVRKVVANGLDDEPTTLKGLIGQMKESTDWDWAFLPNGATGGGSAGRGGAGRAGSVRTKADLGDPEKHPGKHSAYIDEHGLDSYRALPAGV